MGNTIHCKTAAPSAFAQQITVRSHTFSADVGPASGSVDSAPGPHDYFDAALAACKALTATSYARRKGIPLERVESHVERDDSEETAGKYRLRVRMQFFGPLTEEQRAGLTRVVDKCPIHKLMTTAEVQIESVG